MNIDLYPNGRPCDFALMLRRSLMHRWHGKPHVYRMGHEWRQRDERGVVRLCMSRRRVWKWLRRVTRVDWAEVGE